MQAWPTDQGGELVELPWAESRWQIWRRAAERRPGELVAAEPDEEGVGRWPRLAAGDQILVRLGR